MYFPIYPNFQSAYFGTLAALYTNGEWVDTTKDPLSVGSNFGGKDRPTKELMNFSFAIENPIDRMLNCPIRKFNLNFAIANAIWTLSGSDSLEWIAYYNARGNAFSDNNKTLSGAHGKRLFSLNGINQVNGIVERLRLDRFSRRTVAVVYNQYDSVRSSKDIPCVISLQFLQRKGRLNLSVSMRSQSAAMVMPYDIFTFTFLHEAVARVLGMRVGRYYHHCTSFHHYLDEEELIEKILSQPVHDQVVPPPSMPADVDPFREVYKIVIEERKLRDSNHEQLEIWLPENSYWRDLYLILIRRIFEKKGIVLDKTLALERQSEYYLLS